MLDGAIPDISTLAGTDVAIEQASLAMGEAWFECQIAGLQFHSYDVVDDLTGARLRPEAGDRLHLVREPTNAYDENAVEVWWKNSHRLGHLPRLVAAEIAPLIDAGAPARAYAISGGTGRAWSVRALVIGAAGAPFHQKHLDRLRSQQQESQMPVNAPSFVDGLVALDASQTRKRLAAALAEARLHAQWTASPSGDGIAEAIRHVDSVLLESARWAIKRLDDALLASRSAPARQETLAEAHAAVVAALDRDDNPITPVRPTTPGFVSGAFGRRSEAPPPGC